MQTQYIVKNEDCCFYYSDMEMNIWHRTDGPAVEYSNGTKFWYLNGRLHRTDGPAVEWPDGTEEWFINDHKLSLKEIEERKKLIELTNTISSNTNNPIPHDVLTNMLV